jgi:hypothetical protein
MANFERNLSAKWHNEVPGARWFRSDLHLHTLDDHPSGNLQRPACASENAADSRVQIAYARAFLQGAIANGVEVLGLTPHAVKSGSSDETSATWRIVEVWNTELDDDGVPFRDKIYAVFPGFEPNLADGSEGLHLLFLFDPEIQREHYLNAFTAIMGAVPPWEAGSLRISNNDAKSAFEFLRKLRDRVDAEWDYICLAAHAFGGRGLFSLKSGILAHHFPHECVRGLELKDTWLPEDAFADKPWLEEGMRRHRHALFHSSDAYSIDEIGNRFTLIKLSRPRVESLRQAFLAPDSRIRISYDKDSAGRLRIRVDLPDSLAANRPWLRSISVKGGTSFFGGLVPSTGDERKETFNLNPDLTCVIGGRMSGKSTLLDGTRVFCELDPPDDEQIRSDVENRARKRFLSGGAKISCETRGPINTELPLSNRWPAQFFSQRELQKAVDNQLVRRQILYRLIPAEADGLIERAEAIEHLDRQLWSLSSECDVARQQVENAEEAFDLVRRSKEALDRFASAGVQRLTEAQTASGRVEALENVLKDFQEPLADLAAIASVLRIPELKATEARSLLEGSSKDTSFNRIAKRVRASVRYLSILSNRLERIIYSARESVSNDIDRIQDEVQNALVAAGGTAEELNQFDALTSTAADFELRQGEFTQVTKEYRAKVRSLIALNMRRSQLIKTQRQAMSRVGAAVFGRFGGRIRIIEKTDADDLALQNWLVGFKGVGVTRWWNSRKALNAPPVSPQSIRRALSTGKNNLIGMSEQVFNSFSSSMSKRRRFELYSLRNIDNYSIELEIDADINGYREIDMLSGGAQASVLLSLVLETDDSQPLVLDQPEDELDRDYLLDIILPALRRLKGRRQIIFATHDANIVVNGDADRVIYLKADHDRGYVEEEGTIDDPDVRDAILNILDGGADAFSLRRAKYGF